MMRTIKNLIMASLMVAATTGMAQENDVQESRASIADFKEAHPKVGGEIGAAYGYAVLPTIGKGAVAVGGAYGKGTLFKGGAPVADVNMTQVTIGFQLGGKSYSELILFENKESYDRFVDKDFEFAAQTTAVALTADVSLDAPYIDGVKIYTIAKGGLMGEASAGGQKFKVMPF